MLTCSPQPANDEESDFWQQIRSQIDVAVRKVFHWERTDVMSTEEFRERVVAGTLRNVTRDAHKKIAAGTNNEVVQLVVNYLQIRIGLRRDPRW